MSYFSVTIEEIETVNPIEGADRIQVATVKGLVFNFVIGKDQFKPGDKVLYFPVDSLVPQALAEKLGVAGKLAGKDKNRLKTVKLRRILSQGLVAPVSLIDGLVDRTPESITQFLGITKYEPPEVVCHGGKLVRHVEYVETYDLEGADRYFNVADQMMNIPVYISSKIEGSNFYCGVDATGNSVVGQRSGAIIPDGTISHTWWSTATSQGLIDASTRIRTDLFPGMSVILRGELIGSGIQGDYYNIGKHKVLIFDIKVNDKYLSAQNFLDICKKYEVRTVPILSVGKTLREWLNGRTIKEASNHRSTLIDKLEEGIVIKPMLEQYSNILGGRMVIKQRSPEYLAKSDN
jgi:RNA ligase (TIGR02306 family)